MKYINTWQWVMIPRVNLDKNNKRRTVFVFLLIKETPYNKALFELYGTGLIVQNIRTLDLN